MSKKDIGKILTTATAKQRLLLIAEDRARIIYGEDRILTGSDFNKLLDSFKKPNEIKLYNLFLGYTKAVNNGILNLQGLKYEATRHYSDLRGYILLLNSFENSELLVNSILNEIKDPVERERLAKIGASGSSLLFSETVVDKEGFIDIQTSFERETWIDENGNKLKKPTVNNTHSLWEVMNNVKRKAETSAIRYLSWEKALLDFMEDKGFNVKTYKQKIELLSTEIWTPIIHWAKYYGDNNTGLDKPRIDSLLHKYKIAPDRDLYEIDEAEYNFFRDEIIGDE
jgi:hypothetical protein